MDRAAIRRTDYPAMEGGNPKDTESQPHKWWYMQALTDNGFWVKKKKKNLSKTHEVLQK